jgi:hypothetical protein
MFVKKMLLDGGFILAGSHLLLDLQRAARHTGGGT